MLCQANDLHPLDALKIAQKYELSVLENTAIYKAALLPRIMEYQDFESLPLKIRTKILECRRCIMTR